MLPGDARNDRSNSATLTVTVELVAVACAQKA